MEDYAVFENDPSIVRDRNSKAVLVTDKNALMAHMKQREQSNKVIELETRICGMEDKLDAILKFLNAK